jgi:hypothetical protein
MLQIIEIYQAEINTYQLEKSNQTQSRSKISEHFMKFRIKRVQGQIFTKVKILNTTTKNSEQR